MQKLDIQKYSLTLSPVQLDRFKKLAEDVEDGKITMNQSFKLACEKFRDTEGTYWDGWKANFHDWVEHAKNQGWIDRNDGKITSDDWSNMSVKQPPKALELPQKKDKKGNTLVTIGVIALAGLLIYKIVKTK